MPSGTPSTCIVPSSASSMPAYGQCTCTCTCTCSACAVHMQCACSAHAVHMHMQRTHGAHAGVICSACSAHAVCAWGRTEQRVERGVGDDERAREERDRAHGEEGREGEGALHRREEGLLDGEHRPLGAHVHAEAQRARVRGEQVHARGRGRRGGRQRRRQWRGRRRGGVGGVLVRRWHRRCTGGSGRDGGGGGRRGAHVLR
eukprot:scaffold82480_cov61-Phaeocystis_antarctica.AAC.2